MRFSTSRTFHAVDWCSICLADFTRLFLVRIASTRFANSIQSRSRRFDVNHRTRGCERWRAARASACRQARAKPDGPCRRMQPGPECGGGVFPGFIEHGFAQKLAGQRQVGGAGQRQVGGAGQLPAVDRLRQHAVTGAALLTGLRQIAGAITAHRALLHPADHGPTLLRRRTQIQIRRAEHAGAGHLAHLIQVAANATCHFIPINDGHRWQAPFGWAGRWWPTSLRFPP